MPIPIAEVIIELLLLYIGVGVVFAIPFCWRGVNSVDASAREAGVFFRILIGPGTIALWPLLAWRWQRRGTGIPPDESNAHRLAARLDSRGAQKHVVTDK